MPPTRILRKLASADLMPLARLSRDPQRLRFPAVPAVVVFPDI